MTQYVVVKGDWINMIRPCNVQAFRPFGAMAGTGS